MRKQLLTKTESVIVISLSSFLALASLMVLLYSYDNDTVNAQPVNVEILSGSAIIEIID